VSALSKLTLIKNHKKVLLNGRKDCYAQNLKRAGNDVRILKIFSPKNGRKIGIFFTQTTASFSKI
jgi:hypothetical protein